MSRARATANAVRQRHPFSKGRRKLPNAYWADSRNVRKAITGVCRQTGRSPAALTWDDFESCGFSGLLQHYDSVNPMLASVGIRIPPGVRGKNVPGYWNVRANRIEAVRMVRQKIRKEFHELKRRDYLRCGVGGDYPFRKTRLKMPF